MSDYAKDHSPQKQARKLAKLKLHKEPKWTNEDTAPDVETLRRLFPNDQRLPKAEGK